MESTAEGQGETPKVTEIRPPRLEDAGLEDCALPPDAIMEAFARAANFLKSRVSIASDEHEGEGTKNGDEEQAATTRGLGLVGDEKRMGCGRSLEVVVGEQEMKTKKGLEDPDDDCAEGDRKPMVIKNLI